MSSQTKLSSAANYLNHDFSILSWLLTNDHKRLAILYLGVISLFLILGGAAAVLLRLEHMTPAADLMQNDAFKRVYSVHGFSMVYLAVLPAIPGVLGNFLVPLMIGARNVAFPRLNLFGFYTYLVGGILMIYAIFLGGVDTGWRFYAPYSSEPASLALVLTGLSLIVVSLTSILLAV